MPPDTLADCEMARAFNASTVGGSFKAIPINGASATIRVVTRTENANHIQTFIDRRS